MLHTCIYSIAYNVPPNTGSMGNHTDSISPVPHLCCSTLSNASEETFEKQVVNLLHKAWDPLPTAGEAGRSWSNRFNIPSEMFLSKQQPSTVIKPPEHPLAFPSLIYFWFLQYLLSRSLFSLLRMWFTPCFAVGTCVLPPSEERMGLVHSLPLISLFPHRESQWSFHTREIIQHPRSE